MGVTGYKNARKTYRLSFEDEDMDGLVIRARSLPMRKFLDMATFDKSLLQDGAELSREDVKVLTDLFDDFASVIIEWNLIDDDDQPIPVSCDSLLDQDPGWVLRVFMAWMQAIASVPTPLVQRSSVGTPFPEDSIPMAPQSTSLAS